jgi:hypothetical protein
VSLIARDIHKFVSMHPEKDLDGNELKNVEINYV